MRAEDDGDRVKGWGEPRPERKAPGMLGIAGYISAGLMLAGSCIGISGPCHSTRVRGATRSARLQWVERQREISEAVAAECRQEAPAHETDAAR